MRSSILRGRPFFPVAAAVIFSLTASLPVRADLLYFKDGFVLQGKVKRESKVQFDFHARDMIIIPKGFPFFDDGPRRIYFHHNALRDVEGKAPPLEEIYTLRGQGILVTARTNSFPSILEVVEAPPFNARWRRLYEYRTKGGRLVKIPQQIVKLTPYFIQVDAQPFLDKVDLRKRSPYWWGSAYLTREFGPEVVSKLLATHPEFTKKGLKPAALAARRLRLTNFYAQAGWYDLAEKELDELGREQPDKKERIEEARRTLTGMRTRERFEAIKRMDYAGQTQALRKALADFPEKGISEEFLVYLREVRARQAASDLLMKRAQHHLTECASTVVGMHAKLLTEAATTIRRELHPSSVRRLDAFLSQAEQAERQRKAGKVADLNPAQLLSLAVGGWLLGSPSSEARPEVAARLWRARGLVLEYQRTGREADRIKLVQTFLKETNQAPLDEFLQLIPNLPPAEPEVKLGTDPVKMTVGARGPTYYLQLPPEYTHSRHFPVLIVLHDAGETALDHLKRWSKAAAANGFLLVAPDWSGGKKEANYGYTEDEHATVLDTIRDLRRRFQVDSDRIFLFGLGEGGTMAFDVGLTHPSLFAGVMPMNGNPAWFPGRLWRNAQYLPLYVMTGNRSGDLCQLTRDLFMQNFLWHSYPTLWVEYKGRGREWLGGEVPNVFDWMRYRRRPFPRHQLGTEGFGTSRGNEFGAMHPMPARFYWLSSDKIADRNTNTIDNWKRREPATITARIDPDANTIYVRSSGFKQLTLWLGRDAKGRNMIDFDRNVLVRFGLALRFNKRVTPSLATLLEDLYQRGDRQQLFLAKIEFALK